MVVYKVCEKCGIVKFPRGIQKYCGSAKNKTGCSYKVLLERNVNIMREYRKNNPNYARENYVKYRDYYLDYKRKHRK